MESGFRHGCEACSARRSYWMARINLYGEPGEWMAALVNATGITNLTFTDANGTVNQQLG
jgi:hypothetical protein